MSNTSCLLSGLRGSFDHSLWSHTSPLPEPFPSLQSSVNIDVLVIGAGYTGLTAAIELLERNIEVAVIDAQEPGFGASGRNGGQVIPFMKHDPATLMAMFGDEVGRSIIDLTLRSADTVFDLIRRHNIDCDAVQTGWIQGGRSSANKTTLLNRSDIWARAGASARWLDTEDIKVLSGSSYFNFGWFLEGGGSVQPLKYARGLADVVRRLGGSVYVKSPAIRMSVSGKKWSVSTPGGEILANRVVLATNGYTTNLWPGLEQSTVPVYSMQVATEPLALDDGEEILPGGQTMTDTLRLVHYFRRDAQGRFVIGARGPFKDILNQGDARYIIAKARTIYPQLKNVDFPFLWSGRVAMTADYLPHLHHLAPGVTALVGFNGRGVGMATTLGRVLAAACLDNRKQTLPYPTTALNPIRFHGLNQIGVRLMIAYYRVLDRIS
ncbi:NAD(P)/FAD-dependent oxidoreductase [Paralcaligenes ureilyticus]|uniref:Glycine/D-amino acid oxidase-like deaminating enzyme n=1 Tax=Paralcaligenes ureilyticus TaxID=627131 RepID=A0A4R3M843_9BURK|nr:FAD-binding oxidoreductase [Paralcaligenes ureilyticus]TCT09664.1 glycine/D-amino acid oxidase-like deaminating enzyme [Paralcaligenes ureilyticus]